MYSNIFWTLEVLIFERYEVKQLPKIMTYKIIAQHSKYSVPSKSTINNWNQQTQKGISKIHGLLFRDVKIVEQVNW